MNARQLNGAEIALCGLVFLVAVPLEVYCAFLAFETIGEVVSAVYFLALGLNLLFLFVAFWNRLVAALATVALALAIVPYQLVLGERLLRVQAEAARIVGFAYAERARTGSFPQDLQDYRFHDRAMKPFIQNYSTLHEDGFQVTYRVGTENTSHWFSSADGWGYYPD